MGLSKPQFYPFGTFFYGIEVADNLIEINLLSFCPKSKISIFPTFYDHQLPQNLMEKPFQKETLHFYQPCRFGARPQLFSFAFFLRGFGVDLQ